MIMMVMVVMARTYTDDAWTKSSYDHDHDDHEEEEDYADGDDVDDANDDDGDGDCDGLRNIHEYVCRTILTVCSVVTMRTWSPIASSALPKSEDEPFRYKLVKQ